MQKCNNPLLGMLITRYELNLLTEDEKNQFEDHLLQCDSCSEDLFEMADVVKNFKEDPDVFINALKENIRHNPSWITKMKEVLTSAVDNSSALIAPLFTGYKLITIGTSLAVIIIAAIMIWKSDLFKDQIQETRQLRVENNKPLKNPDTGIASDKPSEIKKQAVHIPNTNIAKYNDSSLSKHVVDFTSLATIKHEPYQSLLSAARNETNADRIFENGIDYYEEKEYQRAIVPLSLLGEKDNKYNEAQLYLGISYLILNDVNRGIVHLKISSLSGNSNIKEVSKWYLGNAYLLRNDPENAKAQFRDVIDLKGKHQNEAKEILNKIL